MSAATEIAALRSDLASVKAELAQLKAALDSFFDTFSRDQYTAWRSVKRAAASGEIETPGDVTVGKGLPAAPIRTELNNIGGATI